MLIFGSREINKGIAEQVRGMKVRSSVKKLCEGCKVRLMLLFGHLALFQGVDERKGILRILKSFKLGFKKLRAKADGKMIWVPEIRIGDLYLGYRLTSSQSVRRKGGKLGKGYLYIICSLNPKHKQRQGK